MWQHVKLSEQIRPRDTLTCCWDVKQPTNNNNLLWFRGFRTRMVYLDYITCLRYTILVGNPRSFFYSLCGPVVKASASRAADPGSIPCTPRGAFSWSSLTSDLQTGKPVAVATQPGVVGSALGLFVQVSVYCDWVR